MLVLSPHFCCNSSENETDCKKEREGETDMAASRAALLRPKRGQRLSLKRQQRVRNKREWESHGE